MLRIGCFFLLLASALAFSFRHVSGQEPGHPVSSENKSPAGVPKDIMPDVTAVMGKWDVKDGWRRFIGQTVAPRSTMSCFRWNGRYACFPTVPSEQVYIVFAPEFRGAAKQLIDRRCGNMAAAVACRPWPLVFEIESGEVNMEGTAVIYQAKRIWHRAN